MAVVGSAAWWAPSWQVAPCLTLVLLLVALSAGLHPTWLARALRPLALALALLAAYHVWAGGPAEAARIVLGIANAVLAAGLLMSTTDLPTMLDGVAGLARPLRRWVHPDTVALTIGIVLRTIPWLLEAWRTVRQAAAARGLERSPRALLLPFVLAAVRQAEATGEALAARGITDRDEA